MKSEKNILIAFLLNLAFSVFELFGGIFTGSVAILSDALHDLGDAVGIGASFALEKKSKRGPDARYTYGYARYSVLGGVITSLILFAGSLAVIAHAISRILTPQPIDDRGMIVFAVVGLSVNLLAAFFTREGESVNQRAVNLHMLEDVLGWAVVLIGAVILRFTDFYLIDPVLSIGIAVFILAHAAGHLGESLSLFLERVPQGICPEELREHIERIDGVIGAHHIHVWSVDGARHCATMHIVTGAAPHEIKERVREELAEHGIGHVTLELEAPGEPCREACCHMEPPAAGHHHHHHHHHG